MCGVTITFGRVESACSSGFQHSGTDAPGMSSVSALGSVKKRSPSHSYTSAPYAPTCEVEAARSAGPSPVLVRNGPSFPCRIQTTHPWSQHLEIALRRDGQDRAVRTDGFGVVIVDFRQNMPGDRLPLPQLETDYALMVLRNAHGRPASGTLPNMEPR